MPLRLLLTEDVSPHKILLLFLVGVYCTGNIVASEVRVVLRTIVGLLENEKPLRSSEGKMVIIPGVLDIGREIRYDSTTWALLLSSLWRINSVESLECTVQALSSLLCSSNTVCTPTASKTVSVASGDKKGELSRMIHPRSLIGLFLQKMITTFSLLHFDESLLLYEAFVSYRQKSVDEYSKILGGKPPPSGMVGDTQHDIELYSILAAKLEQQINQNDPPQITQNDPQQLQTQQKHNREQNDHELVPVPRNDFQILLRKLINILESNGTATPKEIKEIMELMTSPNSNTMLIQNAEFNNLPSFFYISYLEALRDGDYNKAFASIHRYFDYMVSNNSKYFYHFALISRASLHEHFGEDEKALDSIQEAISVARENKDHSTLTFILLWFYNFMRNKPHLWYKQSFNNEQHLLEILVNKSQLVGLSLYATSFHYEALHVMNSGNSSISKYLDLTIKATYISLHETLEESFNKSMELNSTIWLRIGNTNLGQLYSELSINPFNTDNILIRNKVENEIRHCYILFDQGLAELAYSKIQEIQRTTTEDLSLGNAVRIRAQILLIRMDLKRGRERIAESVISKLIETEVKELELQLELMCLYAEVQMVLGNFSKAVVFLSEKCLLATDIRVLTKITFLKCKIFIRSGNPARGLLVLLKEIQRCKQIGMISLVVEGVTILISLLISMESYKDALFMIQSTMASILMVGNQEYISTTYYNYAIFIMKEIEQNKASVGKFLKILNIAIDGFRKSVDLVMLKKCFELEKELAKLKNLQELEVHANSSLEKLQARLEDEAKHGFIQ